MHWSITFQQCRALVTSVMEYDLAPPITVRTLDVNMSILTMPSKEVVKVHGLQKWHANELLLNGVDASGCALMLVSHSFEQKVIGTRVGPCPLRSNVPFFQPYNSPVSSSRDSCRVRIQGYRLFLREITNVRQLTVAETPRHAHHPSIRFQWLGWRHCS